MSKEIIPKKKQKLIYLKWQDAHSAHGWATHNELTRKVNEDACICEEVGWVVYEDKNEIHIVARRCCWDIQEKSSEHEYGMYQRIPRTWIMDRQEIKVKQCQKR